LSNAKSRTIFPTKSNVVLALLSNNVEQTEHIQFVSTLSKGRNFTKNLFDIVAKMQQCRSNIRLCRKNRSACSIRIRQRCFDIVTGLDGALRGK